jgi:hypothetical protein
MKLESRRNSALVNKSFYSKVCDIDNAEDIYKLTINPFSLDLHEVFNSIRWSMRAVTEIEISKMYFILIDSNTHSVVTVKDEIFELLLEICHKFSPSIKKLTFDKCLLTDKNVIDILLTLNEGPLEELKILNSGIFYTGIEVYPKDLKLPNLKSIDMRGTNFGHPFQSVGGENLITNFFMALPDHCKTLESFAGLPTVVDIMPLEKFYFTSLGILGNEPFRKRISTIICRQYRLKELDLSSTFIMDDVVQEILKLPCLESLKINCQAISIREFSKICKIETLKALHLEVYTNQHWVPNALSTFSFVHVSKLSIDISQMEISPEALRDMFRPSITHLELKTTQKMALQSVFTSPCCHLLETLKIEYVFVYDPRGKHNRGMFREIRQGFTKLKSLTLINRIPELAGCTGELVMLINRFSSLRKVHFEGFIIVEHLHKAALSSLESTLEDLTLIDHTQKGYEPSYVIPPQCARSISKNKNLKKMVITATHNYFEDPGRFPIVKRVGREIIFCHR